MGLLRQRGTFRERLRRSSLAPGMPPVRRERENSHDRLRRRQNTEDAHAAIIFGHGPRQRCRGQVASTTPVPPLTRNRLASAGPSRPSGIVTSVAVPVPDGTASICPRRGEAVPAASVLPCCSGGTGRRLSFSRPSGLIRLPRFPAPEPLPRQVVCASISRCSCFPVSPEPATGIRNAMSAARSRGFPSRQHREPHPPCAAPLTRHPQHASPLGAEGALTCERPASIGGNQRTGVRIGMNLAPLPPGLHLAGPHADDGLPACTCACLPWQNAPLARRLWCGSIMNGAGVRAALSQLRQKRDELRLEAATTPRSTSAPGVYCPQMEVTGPCGGDPGASSSELLQNGKGDRTRHAPRRKERLGIHYRTSVVSRQRPSRFFFFIPPPLCFFPVRFSPRALYPPHPSTWPIVLEATPSTALAAHFPRRPEIVLSALAPESRACISLIALPRAPGNFEGGDGPHSYLAHGFSFTDDDPEYRRRGPGAACSTVPTLARAHINHPRLAAVFPMSSATPLVLLPAHHIPLSLSSSSLPPPTGAPAPSSPFSERYPAEHETTTRHPSGPAVARLPSASRPLDTVATRRREASCAYLLGRRDPPHRSASLAGPACELVRNPGADPMDHPDGCFVCPTPSSSPERDPAGMPLPYLGLRDPRLHPRAPHSCFPTDPCGYSPLHEPKSVPA